MTTTRFPSPIRNRNNPLLPSSCTSARETSCRWLPADEKIIYEGSVYSTENPEPDLSDCVFINDYSNYEPFLNWDWEKEPLYWRCLYLLHPLPGTTYYVRGYVQTNKAEYYSNTVEIRSSLTAPVAENPFQHG